MPALERPTAALVAQSLVSEPRLTAGLDYVISAYPSRGVEILTRLTEAERTEARLASAFYVGLIAPLAPDQIAAWLRAVSMACARQPSPPEERMRVASVLVTSKDLVAGVWTSDTRAEFSRHSKGYWPGDAEIDQFLRPISNRLAARGRLLAEIGHHETPEQPKVRGTPDQRERAQRAPTSSGPGQVTRPGLARIERPPTRLTPADLIETYRQAAANPHSPTAFAAMARARLAALVPEDADTSLQLAGQPAGQP